MQTLLCTTVYHMVASLHSHLVANVSHPTWSTIQVYAWHLSVVTTHESGSSSLDVLQALFTCPFGCVAMRRMSRIPRRVWPASHRLSSAHSCQRHAGSSWRIREYAWPCFLPWCTGHSMREMMRWWCQGSRTCFWTRERWVEHSWCSHVVESSKWRVTWLHIIMTAHDRILLIHDCIWLHSWSH